MGSLAKAVVALVLATGLAGADDIRTNFFKRNTLRAARRANRLRWLT
jgi:hypothetical protein